MFFRGPGTVRNSRQTRRHSPWLGERDTLGVVLPERLRASRAIRIHNERPMITRRVHLGFASFAFGALVAGATVTLGLPVKVAAAPATQPTPATNAASATRPAATSAADVLARFEARRLTSRKVAGGTLAYRLLTPDGYDPNAGRDLPAGPVPARGRRAGDGRQGTTQVGRRAAGDPAPGGRQVLRRRPAVPAGQAVGERAVGQGVVLDQGGAGRRRVDNGDRGRRGRGRRVQGRPRPGLRHGPVDGRVRHLGRGGPPARPVRRGRADLRGGRPGDGRGAQADRGLGVSRRGRQRRPGPGAPATWPRR